MSQSLRILYSHYYLRYSFLRMDSMESIFYTKDNSVVTTRYKFCSAFSSLESVGWISDARSGFLTFFAREKKNDHPTTKYYFIFPSVS